MTSRVAISDEAQASVRAYEALRGHVLAGASAGGSHAGLVLLLRQGVAAWMARRLTCAAPAAACTNARLVGEEIHAGVVRVLASMAMAAQQEGRV